MESRFEALVSLAEVIARLRGDTSEALHLMERELSALDPRVQPYDFSLGSLLARATRAEQLAAALVGAFAVLALILVAGGVLAVMLQLVREQERELGICVAVGASPREIVRHVVRFAASLFAVSLIVGIPTAECSMRALLTAPGGKP